MRKAIAIIALAAAAAASAVAGIGTGELADGPSTTEVAGWHWG